MKSFEENYKILNPEQKKAVDTIDGPVFVMAGPGTGKTQILTLRIANIVKQTDVDPENILALTFTNAAAYNMTERLSSIIGAEQAHRVYIATFHAFAEDMMKRHNDLFPETFGSRLISPVEQIELVQSIVESITTEYFSVFKRREGTIKSITFEMGNIKGEGMTADEFRAHVDAVFENAKDQPDMFYKRKTGNYQAGDMKPLALIKIEKNRDKNLELADIYEAYQLQLREKNLYDFNDVIIYVVHELQKPDSLFKAELQEQFQYILVDEHQDTNDAQNNIIRGLIDNPVWEGKPNLFVVGDAKQAIFRFAGASNESYKRLLQLLTNPMVITLEENYRSHQEILDSAHSIISHSPYHEKETNLSAFFSHEGVLEYREFHDYKMEMLWLVLDIKDRLDKGENPNEIAVLYRNNKDADDIRRLMNIVGISYKDFSKKNILTDPTMLKLFLLLRAIYNPLDNEAVAKSLFIDFLKFKVFDVQRILHKSRNAKGVFNSALITILGDDTKLKEAGIESAEEREKFIAFHDSLADQKSRSENNDFLGFFSDMIRMTGFLSYILSHKNSVIELSKLEKLFDEIKNESASRSAFAFEDFMHYLQTMKYHGITMNVTNTLSDGVSLLTFHGSKGLEFETVYIIKALHKRKMGREINTHLREFSDGETDDERRLFYVAVTRAKKNCLVSSYIHNEEGREKNRSIHINEMKGAELIDMSQWEKENLQQTALFFNESNEHIRSLINHEYIKEKFVTSKLSVSALNNYVESPLKYFFRNLMYLPEARSAFLDFGNLVHGTMEEYFKQCITEQKILNINVFESSFNKVIDANPLYEEYKERAWDICKPYFERYKDSFTVPIDNEFRVPAVAFELENETMINLTGVVDKITRNEDGSIVVWDYKTGRAYSDMDKDRKSKVKRQAAFYKLLLQNAFGGKYNFHTAIFDFVEPNKKGEYERAEFEITQADVDEVITNIKELAADIFNGTLLEKDFHKDVGNKELLEFLEVLRGPETKEQLGLFEAKN